MFSKEELGKIVHYWNYDLILLGDGSGTRYGEPIGFYSTVYDVEDDEFRKVYGSLSTGTNNSAELLPYIISLWDFHARRIQLLPKIKVCILSDSEITVKCGNSLYNRAANASLWSSIKWFETNGYTIDWVWVPRNTNPFHVLADKEAGELRKWMMEKTQNIADGMD